MPILDNNIRHIKCDGPNCPKDLMFDRKDERVTFENPDNAWLKTSRVVQTADGRNKLYCSDACEVEGVKTGEHNLPEAPKVAPATSQDLSAAVAMAKARAQADEAIRKGAVPQGIQITDGK